MSNSVGTKARKKQPALLADVQESKALEQVMLSLENICVRILDSSFTSHKQDVDGLYWQRKFHNIVTPVSLALAECKGPRRFHFHYKHKAGDDSVLQPVMENPLQVLAGSCREALRHCQTELVGIDNERIVKMRNRLESGLHDFLSQYEEDQ